LLFANYRCAQELLFFSLRLLFKCDLTGKKPNKILKNKKNIDEFFKKYETRLKYVVREQELNG
jgi:hypothetical protein